MHGDSATTGLPALSMSQVVTSDPAAAQAQALIAAILGTLHERTGCDFSYYRPATVYRRIRNRMISLGVERLDDYLRLLRSSDDEALRLLERVTIKVSRFYRNGATFELLRREIIPAFARSGRPVRLWSAGCGFGEEAYSLAMLLEAADVTGYVEASDIDPAALAAAAIAVYPPEALAELPAEFIARYLEPVCVGQRAAYRVRDILRRRVRFSRHDLTAGVAPPGGERFDLVCCRNVFIYLQRNVQQQALRGVCDALVPGGFLCLGEAEWPAPPVAALLQSLGRKTHVFRMVEHLSPGATE